jgi:uncharacterized protein (UPF0335 family)
LDDIKKLLAITNDVDLKKDLEKVVSYNERLTEMDKKLKSMFQVDKSVGFDPKFLRHLGVSLKLLVGENGSLIADKIKLSDFILKTIPILVNELKDEPQAYLAITLTDNVKRANQNLGHGNHAIYLNLKPPFKLQDVNLPGFNDIQAQTLEEFQQKLLGWFLEFPYTTIIKVEHVIKTPKP